MITNDKKDYIISKIDGITDIIYMAIDSHRSNMENSKTLYTCKYFDKQDTERLEILMNLLTDEINELKELQEQESINKLIAKEHKEHGKN